MLVIFNGVVSRYQLVENPTCSDRVQKYCGYDETNIKS